MIFNFFKNIKTKFVLTALVAAAVLTGILISQVAEAAEADVSSSNNVSSGKDVLSGVANLIGGFALGIVTGPIIGILYVVNIILGGIITFVSFLVDTAIDLGNNILKVDAVTEGWKVILSFTNLGFVLGIIIIAFATILHLETYALKQTLWRLIVAALLVNFSLVIAGGFMSISEVITNTFYKQITTSGGESKSMGDALGYLAQPQKAQEPPSSGFWKDLWAQTKEGISMLTATGQIRMILGITFQIIMNFIIILTFATLFIMLIVRVFALIFLLILSPIVWLLWIFPATKQYFQKWWSEFIRWNFFAPAIMFFIYLAVLTRNNLNQLSMNNLTKAENALKASVSLAENFWRNFMDNIVIMSLLIGGLYVANKFGIAGGNIGLSVASRVGKGVGGWAGRLPLRAGAAGWKAVGGENAGQWLRAKGKQLEASSNKLGWYNPGKYLGKFAANRIKGVGVVAQKAARYKKPGLIGSIKAEFRGKDYESPEKQARENIKNINSQIKDLHAVLTTLLTTPGASGSPIMTSVPDANSADINSEINNLNSLLIATTDPNEISNIRQSINIWKDIDNLRNKRSQEVSLAI